MDNLLEADKNASKGKFNQKGVIKHRQNQVENLINLQEKLIDKSYKTSNYRNFVINEPKERNISSLPYYPDRIVHHAILQIMGNILVKSFTSDTYSCIPKRGIHLASFRLRRFLRERERESKKFMYSS